MARVRVRYARPLARRRAQVAHGQTVEFSAGEVLTAMKLNQAFAGADQRADALANEVFALKLAVGVLAVLSIGTFVAALRGRRWG
ncbi:hypothetical protein WI32_19310 [Burkholderia ubonensis]|nr:hypothetical protein WI32_19310 [Burkholderia ubonensis]KUZ49833.1 hypothetical protein WI33_17305 [Burkholderia ubonensis]